MFIFQKKTTKGDIVKYIGAIDDNYQDAAAVKTKYAENAIDALLAGKEIAQKTTRAIGCSIKVKQIFLHLKMLNKNSECNTSDFFTSIS